MKVLRQLGIILGILLLSHVIQRVIGLPIPSAVLGMFILLVLLLTGVVKLEMIEDVSNFLLKHLTFFFIPAGVSIMTQLNLIKDSWLSFLLVALISTILVIVTTGIISQRLLKVKEGGK
ncbi:MAG: CidA/LrgA family protein [Tissierellia bacterium]|nr:CidA/LrgA family protein [Tissierellia bacterium]